MTKRLTSSCRTQWRTGPAGAIWSGETAWSVTGWSHYCCFVSTFPIDGWPSFEIARPRTLLLYFILVAWCPMVQQINHGIFENKMMSGYFFCRNNMKKQFPWSLGCKRNAHKIYGLKTLDCEQVCTSSRPCIGIKSIYPTIVKNANTLRRLFSQPMKLQR